MLLSGKTVLVGVTGGIAVYKAADVVSRLVKLGANVKVIMTRSAQEFVAPMTFQTLSKNPVTTEMFHRPEKWEVEHISLAEEADAVLIVPATANIIGKLACGIADDMLSTTVMAAKAPKIICPAMNTNMYENPSFVRNMKALKEEGFIFVEPASGFLACGTVGKGRLEDPEIIVEKVVDVLAFPQDLAGKHILVTAGPTREFIDPVRYISNPSTGKMGYAIARNAKRRGAIVTLISGPVSLPDIPGVKKVSVTSAEEMYQAVMKETPSKDIIVKSAAVSDFACAERAEHKVKKTDAELFVPLKRNPDILCEVGKTLKENQVLIGFCMETENLLFNAEKKLKEKNLDMIVANNLAEEGAGFAHDTNIVTLLKKNGSKESLALAEKDEIACRIMTEALCVLKEKNGLRD